MLDIGLVNNCSKLVTFKAGENWNGNANGRPKGARNRRTQEVLDLIQGRGDKDPLDALSDLITNNKDPAIVAQASNILAPYLHSKRSTTPAPRFFPEPVVVPTFTTIEQAEDYLAQIPVMLGNCSIDSQSALELSTLVRNWIEAKLAHTNTDLKVAAQGNLGDATIRIEGGMPALPGTSIIMDDTPYGSSVPAINGHQGPSIEHQPSDAPVTVPVHGAPEPPKDPTEGLSD
jgi:hypothetical protein